jgi:hypothetical protein
VAVNVVGGLVDEPNETFELRLSAPSANATMARGTADQQGAGAW